MTVERHRVFHLIKSLGRGGAEMLLRGTLRAADRDRFTYGYGYFLPWKDQVVSDLEAQGAEVVCFGAATRLGILFSAHRVARFLEEWRADVLHCHLPLAGVVGRVAGRMARVPVVYTEHNTMERYHPLTRRINLATWRWQEQVVAVSRDVAETIERYAGSAVPVRVVANGVDVGRFRRGTAGVMDPLASLGVPAGAPVVGTVAVFREQKRLDLWLRAAMLLHRERPDVRFAIIGGGPLAGELEELTRELGLAEVVHFPGLQEDVRPFLARMDVYMMSSAFEGLPVALLEAMAMECGVVATPVGGIPEAIENGVEGILVGEGDAEALASAAGSLLADAARRRRMGAAARQTVVRRFSVERMMADIEEIYQEVLQRHGR